MNIEIFFLTIGLIAGFTIALAIGSYMASKKITHTTPTKRTVNIERNTLSALRRINPERCKVFGHTVQDMGLAFWSVAVAGECGEMCNIIKKKLRGDAVADFHGKVGREAADQVIYLDLLCSFLGISLEEFVILKFNEVSDERGSLIKL